MNNEESNQHSVDIGDSGNFSYGCAEIDKNTKVKCPTCGAVFTIDEGLAGMRGGY